jgi:hypothetical protein
MNRWTRVFRLGLAAILGLAAVALGISGAFSRSSDQEGFVSGIIFSIIYMLAGSLIFYSQWRYENKLTGSTAKDVVGHLDAVGSGVLVRIGSLLVGLGHVAFGASALYLVLVAYSMYSGGGASGIPLVAGIFGGTLCYFIGDAFKKSG